MLVIIQLLLRSVLISMCLCATIAAAWIWLVLFLPFANGCVSIAVGASVGKQPLLLCSLVA